MKKPVPDIPTLSFSVPLAADARKQNIFPVFFIICKILCKVSRVTRSGTISWLFCPAALAYAGKWLHSPCPTSQQRGEHEEPGAEAGRGFRRAIIHATHMCFCHKTDPHRCLSTLELDMMILKGRGAPVQTRAVPWEGAHHSRVDSASNLFVWCRRFGCYLVVLVNHVSSKHFNSPAVKQR